MTPLLPLCRLSATESGLDEEREGPSFSEEEEECSGGWRVDKGADEVAAALAVGGRKGVGR